MTEPDRTRAATSVRLVLALLALAAGAAALIVAILLVHNVLA
jgi:hypothetical protein